MPSSFLPFFSLLSYALSLPLLRNQSLKYSYFVPPRLHHWLSAILACSPSVTGLFRTPLLVFGTVCSNTSPPHPLWPSSSPMLRLICSPSCITPFIWYSARAITFVALHTIIAQCYYTVWVKKITPSSLQFSDIFSQMLENFKSIFCSPIIRSNLR